MNTALYVMLYIFVGLVLFFFLCFVVEIILMGCGINVQEKTIPAFYKNEMYTNDILQHFSADKPNLELKIKKGLKNIANKRIVLCFLARDVEKQIQKNIDKVMIFVRGCKDYRIVVFENDSKDHTRQRLREWANKDKKVILLSCCDEGVCDCKLQIEQIRDKNPISNNRISKMSMFRNKYLDYVLQHFQDYDYMVVLDVDIRGGVYGDGYLTCFADDDWDAIFARGVKPFPFMFGKITMVYDALAFLDLKNPIEIKKNIFKSLFQLQQVYNKKIGSDNVPVLSAFNGVAVYKIQKIIESSARYGFQSGCEHVDFHNSLRSRKLYANPSFVVNMGIDNDSQMPFTFLFNIFKNL